MTEPSELACYQEMLRLYEQMAAAARAGDWDKLVELERHSAKFVTQLGQSTALPETDPRQKADLIEQILGLQGKIRDDVAAWRQDVAPLLETLAGSAGR